MSDGAKTPLQGSLQGLGRFEGKTHILPISVYYEDTDLSGVVYHANYLRYMERGRTEFFRLAGISKMAGLEEEEPTACIITGLRGWMTRSRSTPALPICQARA